MSIHRRDFFSAFGGVAATAAIRPWSAGVELPVPEFPQSPVTFPRKDDFSIEEGYTYLNAAYTHPIPRVSVDAARRAAEARGMLRPTPPPSGRSGGTATTPNPRALFAELINAKLTEIAY